MKKIVITVIGLGILFLVQGCVSASEYKDVASGIQKCSSYKFAALNEDANKETRREARVGYKRCREAEAKIIAYKVNLCVGLSILFLLPSFGTVLFFLPLCYYEELYKQ